MFVNLKIYGFFVTLLTYTYYLNIILSMSRLSQCRGVDVNKLYLKLLYPLRFIQLNPFSFLVPV